MEKKIEINKKSTYGSAIEEFGVLIVGMDFKPKEVMDIITAVNKDELETEIAECNHGEVLIRPATEDDVKKAITESVTPLKAPIINTEKKTGESKRRLPRLKHFICCDKVGITINDIASCRVCGKEQTFEEEIILDVICPECGKKIIATTNQKDIQFFMCGDCKTHIDVEYDYKTNKVKDLINI
ncbi:MAG: hypothetical protein ACRDCE_06050 [Cetobacterium sp.]|uniref:hypothetical protein n=1 Tax=Cetobacterium sp. TaxID=2071632 RepID=UPI003EE81691